MGVTDIPSGLSAGWADGGCNRNAPAAPAQAGYKVAPFRHLSPSNPTAPRFTRLLSSHLKFLSTCCVLLRCPAAFFALPSSASNSNRLWRNREAARLTLVESHRPPAARNESRRDGKSGHPRIRSVACPRGAEIHICRSNRYSRIATGAGEVVKANVGQLTPAGPGFGFSSNV